MEAKGNPYREAARDELEKIRQTENERYLYLREEMARRDEISRLNTAKYEEMQKNLCSTIQICKEMGASKDQVCESLMKHYLLSLEDAQRAVEAYWS